MTRIRVPTYIITLAIGFTSGMPVGADADLVVGKVSPVPESHTFRLYDSQGQEIKKSPVETDAQGNFAVTLRPGVYSARSDKGKASIRSSNRPLLGQAINFQE